MSDHLPLCELTPFAARYHITRHLRADPRTPAEAKVVNAIEAETDTLGIKKVGLEQSFDQLCQKIEDRIAHFREEISSELFKRLEDVQASLRAHSCSECQTGEQPKCTHDSVTGATVAAGGKCIEPLKLLFDTLFAWTDSLWRELPHGASKPKVPIVLSTIGRSFGDTDSIMQKFFVSGHAHSMRDKTGRYGRNYYTKVSLEIMEDSFGWRQYSLLPYLLLHEILCHGFQSLDDPPRRSNADNSDAWSEGWMDALAFELAREWLHKHDKLPYLARAEFRDAEAAITELHNARYLKPLTAKGISNPGDGRQAFREVVDTYDSSFKLLGQSRHPLTRFSLRLNAMTIPPTERVLDLEKIKHMARRDPELLHTYIANVVAADNEIQARDYLRAALK